MEAGSLGGIDGCCVGVELFLDGEKSVVRWFDSSIAEFAEFRDGERSDDGGDWVNFG